MNRIEIKKRAKEIAFNNKWNLWKPYSIYILCDILINYITALFALESIVILGDITLATIITGIMEIATLPIIIGTIYNNMCIIEGRKLSLKELFTPQYSKFCLIIITIIIIEIYTVLLTCLLIIPGIIYGLKMAMAKFILADPQYSKLSYKEVMTLSKKLMDGHKWEFFVFQLSFILWYLLGLVTLGIAYIWVVPYVETANVLYYQELKKLNQV